MMKSLSVIRIIIILILFSSCTNWKARWVDISNQLEDCQKATSDTSSSSQTVIIDDVYNTTVDTIILPENYFNDIIVPDTVFQEFNFSHLEYKKQHHIHLNNDNIDIYLTSNNYLTGNRLLQKILLDSLKYKKEQIIIRKNVPVTIDKTNIWKSIAVGAISGIIITILGFFILNRWRTSK